MKIHDYQVGKMVAVRRFFLYSFSIFDGGDLMKNDLNHDLLEGKIVAVRLFVLQNISGEIFLVLELLGSKD